MKKVNREELLVQLESVSAGLSPRDVIEQSACFVFSKGEVMTYNDEISCRRKTKLELKGAVHAEPLMKILRKLIEDEVEIGVDDGELIINGKKRSAGIRMDSEVLLPIENVEKPGTWRALHEDFLEAVRLVQECTAKDDSAFWATCVHIHPKWLEASDNFQITRYKIKTGTKEAFLVKRDSIKHILALDVTEISESVSWVHFKNPSGLVLSCRRWTEPFPDLTALLDVKNGSPATLPKGLGEAADKAEIFSSENADNNQVTVELRPGKLRITGEGSSGWYKETKKLVYDGPPLMFTIGPKLLMEITSRHNDCFLTDSCLLVDSGKFRYITCLGKPGEEKEDKQEIESKGVDDGET